MPKRHAQMIITRNVRALMLVTLLLSGCGTIDMRRDLIASHDAIAEARTQAVLLNVLRTSEGLPPMLTLFDAVRTDSGARLDGTLRIPAKIIDTFSPVDVTPGGERFSRAYSESQTTQEFYNGVSQPVSAPYFDAVIRAGTPLVPMLHVMIDRVVVSPLDSAQSIAPPEVASGTYVNNPLHEGYPAAVRWIGRLAEGRNLLSTCTIDQPRQIGPKGVLKPGDFKGGDLIEAHKAGLDIRLDDEGFLQVGERRPAVEFCVGDVAAGARPSTGNELTLSRDTVERSGAISLVDRRANVRVVYVVRSVLGIINHLGQTVHAERQGLSGPVMDATGRKLFVLHADDTRSDPVSVVYKGRRYVLGSRDESYAPFVVGMVVQLLGLNQSARRLPSAGLFRIDD